ncbi:MAG: 16S rRNA (cytosine(1402)-N(4))-methyltransferase RsmH [Pirellulales bacterium]
MSETVHIPVLLDEVLTWLQPSPGKILVDGTLGGGGHTRALAERVAPNGYVLAVDRDPLPIERAETSLKGLCVKVAHASYRELPAVLREIGVERVDGILLDLGLSSDQLADRERGFGFDGDGPLDMRFDTTAGEPAWRWLEHVGEEQLADAIYRYGEERHSRRVARRIIERRTTGEGVKTAAELAKVVRSAVPHKPSDRIDAATRSFQGIRIAVNGELDELSDALRVLPDCLKPGGRLAIISFHSLEDRLVKNAFRDDLRLENLTRKPITAGESELERNPRSRRREVSRRVSQSINYADHSRRPERHRSDPQQYNKDPAFAGCDAHTKHSGMGTMSQVPNEKSRLEAALGVSLAKAEPPKSGAPASPAAAALRPDAPKTDAAKPEPKPRKPRAATGRMPRETKIGLAIIGSLVVVFGYVLYARLTRPADLDADQYVAQHQAATDGATPSTGGPTILSGASSPTMLAPASGATTTPNKFAAPSGGDPFLSRGMNSASPASFNAQDNGPAPSATPAYSMTDNVKEPSASFLPPRDAAPAAAPLAAKGGYSMDAAAPRRSPCRRITEKPVLRPSSCNPKRPPRMPRRRTRSPSRSINSTRPVPTRPIRYATPRPASATKFAPFPTA